MRTLDLKGGTLVVDEQDWLTVQAMTVYVGTNGYAYYSVWKDGNGQRGRIADWIGHNPGIAEAKKAMGIYWMSRDELSQAIPPAYTEYIAHQWKAELLRREPYDSTTYER